MKPIPYLAAALVAALALPVAAQADKGGPATTTSDADTPTTRPDVGSDAAVRAGHNPHAVPRVVFVDEPVASASRQDDRAKAIVDAMNADPSLKDSKITVQPGDDGSITLTGATMTEAQVKRAGEIAQAGNGDGSVINTILPSEVPVAPR